MFVTVEASVGGGPYCFRITPVDFQLPSIFVAMKVYQSITYLIWWLCVLAESPFEIRPDFGTRQ